MYKQIETERLILRPIKLSDQGFMLDLLNTETWLQCIGDRNIRNQKEAEDYIQKILDNPTFFYSVFEIKETGHPIGIITFLHRDKYKYPDLGFAMLPALEKKGYAFEASKAYLDALKNERSVNKIIAITMPENRNSVKLLEKLGLKHEADSKDNAETLHVYAIEINEAFSD